MEAEPDSQSDAPSTSAGAAFAKPTGLKRVSYGWRIVIAVVVYLVVAVITLIWAPARLLNNWVPGLSPEEQGKFLGAAGNLVLLALGGVIAVVTVGLSLSRHRQELIAAERDRQRLHDDQERERARLREVEDQRRIESERALRERFVTTVKLLSDPAPINRQAALYALGALADDWDALDEPEEVQVCIEVLTGYLRAPRSDDMLLGLDPEEAQYTEPEYQYEAQHTAPHEVSVKQAGYTVIRNHIQEGASPHWHDRHLNLSGAYIDFPIEFRQARIGDGVLDLRDVWIGRQGRVDLIHALISGDGRLHLTDAVITAGGSVNLRAAEINHGRVDLSNATIRSGKVNLAEAKITNWGSVILREARIKSHGSVDLMGAAITGGGTVDLMRAEISGDSGVNLLGALISNEGGVNLAEVMISSGGRVDLISAGIREGGHVDFEGAEIGASGCINLRGARISDDARVDIDAVKIVEGGRVVRPNGMLSKEAK